MTKRPKSKMDKASDVAVAIGCGIPVPIVTGTVVHGGHGGH
jgi:hypothetical protein